MAREYRDVLTRRGINDAPISPTVTGNALFDIAEKSGNLINGKIPFGPTRQLLTREQIVSGFEQGKFSPHELTPAVQRKIIDQIKPPGHMYEVNINARPEQFLNWDAPLSGQAPEVQGALSGFGFKARPEEMRSFDDALLAALQDKGPMTLPRQPADPAGEKIYSDLINQSGMTASRARASQAERSSMLREAGIPGHQVSGPGLAFCC